MRGAFVVSQQAVRRVRPGGAIVNFSSSVIGRILPTYTGVAFLAGPAGHWVNGQVIRANGGII